MKEDLKRIGDVTIVHCGQYLGVNLYRKNIRGQFDCARKCRVFCLEWLTGIWVWHTVSSEFEIAESNLLPHLEEDSGPRVWVPYEERTLSMSWGNLLLAVGISFVGALSLMVPQKLMNGIRAKALKP
jgi:hypothetical protein